MGFRRKPQQEETKVAPPASRGRTQTSGKTVKKGSSNFVKVGNLMQTKDGSRMFVSLDEEGGEYTKFDEILLVVNGETRKVSKVQTQSIEEKFEGLVARGVMTEEQAENALNKTPETIVAEVTFILED